MIYLKSFERNIRLIDMKVVYDDVRVLKDIVQALAKLVDEAVLKFKEDNVELVALDRAHISLISVKLPKEMFKEYDVSEEFKFGFNTQYLMKILKVAKRKEAIEISSESPESIIINIIGGTNREFNVRNLEVSEENIPEINLQFDISATISSDGFKSAISEVSTVSDNVIIEGYEDKILIKAEGENEIEVEFSKDTGGLQDLEFSKNSKNSYSGEYLDDVLSLTKLSDFVKIAFGDQKPLQLSFNMEGGGKVTYLLAPKV
ncbi:proliferating cell nuclear antigen PcnA [Sulfolobus islandicus Y.G.57.14]|jgi:DNA polymerase sliding clamp subunit A|uniref:DNA polymerase sliding clamp n=8 Tax=Saccharolobus islandicus TaxID=43080 RepID=C3MR09_SACI2|nr:proliferating cell nuclear antigen (pcna) [Sulfolobus islandicus]ACP35822.1 proliferating cell nuclear antigen PcnA [Sulfolobus islandicus L.S.2.15]ACP46071.1 proliferating cell nuclear antigen PcnA [Sulfolobus islandicus Y.G.57.14]ACP48218.1 proliferating cell nuclear antigen PcnA [Sulfolobus islandicus Y.N.15.51]ACP55689.1 proliferating cell nuclear antigen PcnA [Sulfolobus islandicus M.16.27]ACR42349.1 proliferating cell nuclear antigen PcnA [Sulfolobus islandicus M.16.4]